MSFRVTERRNGDVLVFGLQGRLVIGDPVEEFRRKIDEAIKGGQTRLALDLAGTEYIDSSGMGFLVVAHKVARDAGGMLTMFNLTDRVVDLMLLTKLSGVFHLFSSEQDAVDAIHGKPVKPFDPVTYIQERGEHAPGGE
ncbi:MAG: anti-sigma factor antagonist [Bryobacteraceae bacterium]|nr:MAG: anti-sigma factor antagonist [Bryobacteraceae bacterium]